MRVGQILSLPNEYTRFAQIKDDFGTAYTTASDKIELGYLPASAKLRGARLVSSGLTSTITVGVLAGEAGRAKVDGERGRCHRRWLR